MRTPSGVVGLAKRVGGCGACEAGGWGAWACEAGGCPPGGLPPNLV